MIIITTQCFSPQIGGIESLMTGMANAMANTGENIFVLADGMQEPQDREKNYNIKRFNAWKPIRRIQKANYLKQLCNENDVKAIFADSWKSIEYSNNLNIKTIVLAHGTEIPKQYWSHMANIFRFKRNRIVSSYKNAHKIIANSNYTRELMQASLKIESNKIRIIHPGIDIYSDYISNSDKKKIAKIIHNKSPVITTLARIEKRKGHKFVLKAIADIKDEFPNILYLIAGKGPFLNEVISYAKELKIEKYVKFLGWITEPEKSLILKHSNLFVMTPTITGESVEGFGMAFIDAAFHGIASIGTNSGGINDAIIDRKTGLLCEPENQADITEKIRYILSNTSLRENLGNKGKEIANNHYTWQHKIEEYLKEV